jgi:hypothetical protein
MNSVQSTTDSITFKERINALPEDSVLFRSDFPEYHPEFIGSTLILVKLFQGVYAKPCKIRFGIKKS